jgi:hypothetical protein
MTIKPQAGFQALALSTPADIAFIGGAAGPGKSFCLLLEPTRHINNPKFGGVIFRRTTPQIMNEGGLWDKSAEIYAYLNASPKQRPLGWTFKSGAKISFSHLENETDKFNWQGSEIPYIAFDEMTHFTRGQFFYLLTRNRSTCGVKPYVRASMNPDPESWVRDLIDWYIGTDGFIIPERSGKLRFFMIDKGEFVWGDDRNEVVEKCEHLFDASESKEKRIEKVKSFCFIEGKLDDNKILLEKDPGYKANLLAQDEETVNRLFKGNWNITQDVMSISPPNKINDIFSNLVPKKSQKYITIDHARFGQDLCVIISWEGMRVDRINILSISDTNTILKVVNEERNRLGVGVSNIICDQDGVGVIDALGCKVFQGNAMAFKDFGNKTNTNYKNLKTQCAYKLCEDFINTNQISIDRNSFYVAIYNSNNEFFQMVNSSEVEINKKIYDIEKLIKRQLRTIKRKDADGEGKKQVISKQEQKNLLSGMSPDFADALLMRMTFEYSSTEYPTW